MPANDLDTAPNVRALRPLLLVLMLAFLPLQSWASAAVHAALADTAVVAQPAAIADSATASAPDAAETDLTAAGDPAVPADSADPSQASVDLAEQLLPARSPHLAAGNGRGALPHYAAGPLPEPSLPLPPRPPRG